jgi:hypothetical protein
MDENDALVDALDSFGEEDTAVEPSVPEVVEPVEPEPELTDFGRRYLQTIEDESERSAVERHVRRWDAGYSKQEQKWNDFRSQYEQLGPVEELAVSKQLYNILQTDPLKIAQYLHSKGIIYQPDEPEAPAPDSTSDSAEAQRIARLEQMTQVLLEQKQREDHQRQEQEQIAQFKSDLATARKELGDFDEKVVITLIAGGVPSIEEAVKQYQRLTQNAVNQNARKQAPTLLGSSGTAPTTKPVPKGKLDNKQVTDLLVSLLETE